MRPRAGTTNSIRTQPVPWLAIVSSRPRRWASSCVTVPRYSSGTSMVMCSIGSWTRPSIVLVTTCGLPTVSSKPSRRICSTRIASASSPRPWTSQASGRSVGSTRSETLPTSSVSSRSLTWRAVTLWFLPPLPASGEVLIPTVIEIAGSSTVISGSGRGSSGSVSVSPIVISGMPATATMSPGPTCWTGTRSSALVSNSSVILTVLIVPSARAQATSWPFASVPLKTRSSARRPRNGEASRFVTCACSGAPSTYDGAGIFSTIVANSGSRSALSGCPPSSGWVNEARPAFAEAYTTGTSRTMSRSRSGTSSCRSDGQTRGAGRWTRGRPRRSGRRAGPPC